MQGVPHIHDCPVVVCGSGFLTTREAGELESGKSISPLLKLRSRFGFEKPHAFIRKVECYLVQNQKHT